VKRLRVCLAYFFCALGALAFVIQAEQSEASERRPAFTCNRSNADPRRPRLTCHAANCGDYVPEWRLYGNSEDALMEFNEGLRFSFEVPRQWALLEMRITDAERTQRLRVWVRNYGGAVEQRPWGSE
jgi:hypothetical protein